MTFLVFAVIVLVSVAGRLWFAIERGQSTFRHANHIPYLAAKNLLRERGADWMHVVQSSDNDTYYHLRHGAVFLGKRMALRRDLEAVSIATHEAAHAVQYARHPEVVWAAALCPSVIAACFLVSLAWGDSPILAGMMIAAALFRAGVEADAWYLAHETLQRWRLPGIRVRLAVAGVVSYL